MQLSLRYSTNFTISNVQSAYYFTTRSPHKIISHDIHTRTGLFMFVKFCCTDNLLYTDLSDIYQ